MITGFLRHAHEIDVVVCGEHRARVRATGPPAAHRRVQHQEVGVDREHARVGVRLVCLPVHEEREVLRRPFDGVLVERGGVVGDTDRGGPGLLGP